MWNRSISFYAYVILIVTFTWTNFSIKKWENLAVINWDIIGYYSYLPSTFIYHDYKLNFLSENKPLDKEVKFWPLKAPNGNPVNKFTMGMSMMYAPFFFLAHIISQVDNLPPNGFSLYYQQFIHLSCIFYLFIGLFFLRILLLKWFNEWAVALTLFSITIGTNLFNNASFEAAMSHVYNFSLAAVFLYCAYSWFENNKTRYAIGMGITLGLLVLIRPINIIFVLFPLLYNINSLNGILGNVKAFLSKPIQLILIITLSFLIILPQLLYWKSVTGQFVFFSYIGERFFFLRPMILHGLFSFRNGWLIYSPIMFFSLIGIYLLYKNKSHFTFAVLSIFLIYIYLVFCWWCWWYVGFGNRAMIDLYSLLSIPMAAFYNYVLQGNLMKKISTIILFILFVILNLFQNVQYTKALVHFDSMTFKAYIASFGTLNYNDEYKSSLQSPDYEKAKLGEE